MTKSTLTVTQLNRYIKTLLEGSEPLKNICVAGEISGFKRHSSGTLYFTLKDSGAAVRCVMFLSFAQKLRLALSDGMKVIVSGSVSVYEKTGEYQIYVKTAEPYGMGDIALALEQIKEKLKKEGLFDIDRKRKIPYPPKKIGVITSATGAVYHDITRTLASRYPLAEVVFCPASVQGSSAPQSIISAFNQLNARSDIDVIIFGRGGGSVEDLWCFNDERLVRTVAASRIPTISGIGHETDTSLCDYAADVFALTPTDAAVKATPDIADMRARLSDLTRAVGSFADGRIAYESDRLERYSAVINLRNIQSFTDGQSRIIGELSARLRTGAAAKTASGKAAVDGLSERLKYSAGTAVTYAGARTDILKTRLDSLAKSRTERAQANLSNILTRLEGLNPVSLMNRGYSYATADGNIVKSIGDVKDGSKLLLEVSDGRIYSTVDKTEKRK